MVEHVKVHRALRCHFPPDGEAMQTIAVLYLKRLTYAAHQYMDLAAFNCNRPLSLYFHHYSSLTLYTVLPTQTKISCLA